MTDTEFDAILNDSTKQIDEDIAWAEDEDHSPSYEFRAEVASTPGYPIFVRGSCNQLAGTLSFALIHRGIGRIYALDMGKAHHNPDCHNVGEMHKHRWTERNRDKEAYVPGDITASANDPIAVWSQFCDEAAIVHNGGLRPVPPVQLRFGE